MTNSFVPTPNPQGPPGPRGQTGPTGGPLAASVATAAVLSTIDLSDQFLSGSVAYVQSTKSYWTLDRASAATPDAVTVVAANGGGNWVAQGLQSGWGIPVELFGAKADTKVLLTLETKAGTPGVIPVVTYTPGTGLAIASVSGDSSSYGYTVQ